jgi:glyoxylase-like metal-dependent hydrolase (beta-lactamase superfamily II)
MPVSAPLAPGRYLRLTRRAASRSRSSPTFRCTPCSAAISRMMSCGLIPWRTFWWAISLISSPTRWYTALLGTPGTAGAARPSPLAGSFRVASIVLTMAEGDPAALEIVGRELDGHAITRRNLDVILAHLARDMPEQQMPILQLDAELTVGQRLRHHSFNGKPSRFARLDRAPGLASITLFGPRAIRSRFFACTLLQVAFASICNSFYPIWSRVFYVDVTSEVQPLANGGWDQRVRAFRCGTTVDSFAVITRRWLLIVDTLISEDAMAPVMANLAPLLDEDRSLLVINTHADWDHVWGNGLFGRPGAPFPAPIIGHAHSAARMRSPGAARQLDDLRTGDPARYGSASWVEPTIMFDGELRIDGGDLEIVLIPTPGHTADHVSLWIPRIRLVLVGDAAEAPIPSVDDASSLVQLRTSLQRLIALDAESALYCHAPGIRRPDLIARNLAYFDELEMRCRAMLTTGMPVLQDPAGELGWLLEAAVPDLLPAEEQMTLYRNFHDAAIRAMIASLTESTG